MALTYDTYRVQIANLMAMDVNGEQFALLTPGMITYAEQRIYRELDLIDTIRRNSNLSVLQGNREFVLPTNGSEGLIFYTVQQVNLFYPASSSPETGSRLPLQPVSRDFLDAVYGSGNTYTGTPQYFAMEKQDTIILGPFPDGNYRLEIVGTIRPTPLSSSNQQTILTQLLPDLFVAASMVYATGWQRDYGAQADNPQQGASWEGQYQALRGSANSEELRKKFWGPGWSSLSNTPPPGR